MHVRPACGFLARRARDYSREGGGGSRPPLSARSARISLSIESLGNVSVLPAAEVAHVAARDDALPAVLPALEEVAVESERYEGQRLAALFLSDPLLLLQ